jgi:hypothetical protein
LARVLAAGWRNADPDVAALLAETDGLAAVGFAELAGRIRRVGEAPKEDRLGAVALALAATRLLRARLADTATPTGGWKALESSGRRRASSVERLLPVGRVGLGDGEAWACLRLRGFASDWVLLDPPGRDEPRPWLVQQVQGRLRWQARYPLGNRGDVQLVGVEEQRWLPPPEGGEDLLASFREATLVGKLVDEAPLLRTTMKLQARRLAGDDVANYAWPDPASARAFRSAAGSSLVWAITWVEGSLVTPLAAVTYGLASRARLVHLVPGNPSVEVQR